MLHGRIEAGVNRTLGARVIDFVDLSVRRLVWRGSGTRRLSRDPQPDRLTQRVNEAVDEILAQFPPNP